MIVRAFVYLWPLLLVPVISMTNPPIQTNDGDGDGDDEDEDDGCESDDDGGGLFVSAFGRLYETCINQSVYFGAMLDINQVRKKKVNRCFRRLSHKVIEVWAERVEDIFSFVFWMQTKLNQVGQTGSRIFLTDVCFNKKKTNAGERARRTFHTPHFERRLEVWASR